MGKPGCLERIKANFQLGEPVASGSTAALYRHSPGWLYRLSENSGGHRLLICGHRQGLAFPKVLQDFGQLCPKENTPYYMAILEECFPIPYRDAQYRPLADVLTRVTEIWWDDNIMDRDVIFPSCRNVLETQSEHLAGMGILDTLHFVVDFAEEHEIDLDFDLSNLMINRDEQVVATDLVHGDW